MDRKDLGMGKPGSDPDLSKEALRLVRLRRAAGQQDLDGDLAAVLQVLRQIHRRHAAVTDLFLDAVAIGYGGSQAVQERRACRKIQAGRRDGGRW